MHGPKIRTPGFADLELVTGVQTHYSPQRDPELKNGEIMRFRDWMQFHVGLHPDVIDWLVEAPCPTTRATVERLVERWRAAQCD